MDLQSPPQQPPPKVPIAAIENAVTALTKWKSTKSASEKPQLLPSDEFIYLVLTVAKIPDKARVNAHKILVPHPIYSPENSELCLFVADDTSKSAKSKIEDESLPVAKVLKLTKLRKEYKAYEQKRKLCDSYDLFLAEKKIVPLLPNAIGKWFYQKKKIPVPVELSRGNWKEQIEKVCSSAMLYLSTGTCSVIKVGRVAMGNEEIVENVVAAIEGVAKVVPKKWGNIRSFHLKFAESVALPIYQKVPEVGLKIAGAVINVSEEKKAVEEVKKKSEKVKSKKEPVVVKVKKMKGRIHEVRYMDDVLVGEDESGIESEGEEVVDEEEKETVEKEEVVGKKRKKGNVEKKVKKVDKVSEKKKDSGVKKSKKSKVSV